MEFLPKEVEEIILDYTQQLHKAEFIRRVHRKKFQKTLNIINKIKYKFYDNNLRIVYDDFSSFCYYDEEEEEDTYIEYFQSGRLKYDIHLWNEKPKSIFQKYSWLDWLDYDAFKELEL